MMAKFDFRNIPTITLICDRPEWAEDEGYPMAKDLGGDEWLVIRPMLFHLSLAVVTPPPLGGVIESWDYDHSAQGDIACIQAFQVWPNRTPETEVWTRHTAGDVVRRHVRVEDHLATPATIPAPGYMALLVGGPKDGELFPVPGDVYHGHVILASDPTPSLYFSALGRPPERPSHLQYVWDGIDHAAAVRRFHLK